LSEAGEEVQEGDNEMREHSHTRELPENEFADDDFDMD